VKGEGTNDSDITVQIEKPKTALAVLALLFGVCIALEAVAYVFSSDIHTWFQSMKRESSALQSNTAERLKNNTDGNENDNLSIVNAESESLLEPTNQRSNLDTNRTSGAETNALRLSGCVLVFYPETDGFGSQMKEIAFTPDEQRDAQTECLTIFSQSEVDRAHETALQDNDADGLNDLIETAAGMNPYAVDTDGDGYDDLLEVSTGHNPLEKPSAASLDNTTNPAQ
jgi:hypothetical protein